MRALFTAAAAALLIGAYPGAAAAQDQPTAASVPPSLFAGERSREVLTVQILLDRARHSPGVIDGIMGSNTARAIRAFQGSRGLPVDGRIDDILVQRLMAEHGGDLVRSYSPDEAAVGGPFVEVPNDMADQAALETLAYSGPVEQIAEQFHMSESLVRALNPGANFGSGDSPLAVVAAGPEELPAPVTRIEVDKAASELRAYGEDGTLLASYPATVGSSSFPSPSGSMEVRAVAPEPVYYFDPSGRSWGPDRRLTIAAGPNNPVGSTWIDLSKEGYGIHGTPDPALIGKTASHGCVRLTNWDAEELAKAVSPGTKVEFVS